MRRWRGRGGGGVGSEARERSEAGADVGEGGRRRGRGKGRELRGRKPVVEGEAGDVGGDGPVAVEVGLGADDVDEQIRVTVFPEFWERSGLKDGEECTDPRASCGRRQRRRHW